MYLVQARERLALRIDQGRIGPGQKQTARLALDNLEVLLRKFGVEREEVLEVDSIGVEEAAIRKRVELQLAGKVVCLIRYMGKVHTLAHNSHSGKCPGYDCSH